MEEERVKSFCSRLNNIDFPVDKWDKLTLLEKYLFFKEACLLLSSKELQGERLFALKIYLHCMTNKFLPSGFYDADIYRRRTEERLGQSLLETIQSNDYVAFKSLLSLLNAEAISFNRDEPFRYAVALKRKNMEKDIEAIVLRSAPQGAESEERREILRNIDPNLIYDTNVKVYFVHHPFTLSGNTDKIPNIPLIRVGEKMDSLMKEKGGVWNKYYKGWMFIGDIPHYVPSPLRKGVVPRGELILPKAETGAVILPPDIGGNVLSKASEIYPALPKPTSLSEAVLVPRPTSLEGVVPVPKSVSLGAPKPVPLNLGAPIPPPSKPLELGTPIPPSVARPAEKKSHDHVKPVILPPPPIGEKDPLGDDDPLDAIVRKLSEDKRSGGKKRSKASEKYDKEFQRCDTPDEDSPVRVFYETLYEEKPDSALAICWLVHRGVYEDDDEGQRLLEKYKLLDVAGETVTVGCRAT